VEGALVTEAPLLDVTEELLSRTTPIYLVRHAKAGNRLKWTEPDHVRPLSKPGRRQAKALVALFADQLFSRLLSSPYTRCVQTLEPLAEERKLPIKTSPALAEGARIDKALELMLSVAAEGPAALCTHGDVMMYAVKELLSTGIPLLGPRKFKKGATWILEVRRGAFSLARYLPPPVTPGE
jgi:phosphohistidine phosphatase SixA